MSKHWFKRHRKKVIKARGLWKTQPPHRKVMGRQLDRVAVLAYGAVCLLEKAR